MRKAVGNLATPIRPRSETECSQTLRWRKADLAQLGLIDAATLPVCGADTARKTLDPSLSANALIRRAALM